MKKSISFILVMLMVLCMIPGVAMAESCSGTCTHAAAIDSDHYNTLQDAINAAQSMTGDVTITLLKNISNEDAKIVQKDKLNLTLDGNGYKMINSTIGINGENNYSGAETLTIQNINFSYSGDISGGVIYTYVRTKYHYAHKVTIEHCTFTFDSGAQAFAVRMKQSNGFTISDCEMFRGGELLYNASGGQNITIKNTTVTDASYGVHFDNATNCKLENCNIDVNDFGVRVETVKNSNRSLVITNSKIKASYPVRIQKVDDTTKYNLNLEGCSVFTVIEGGEPIEGGANNFNFTGSIKARIGNSYYTCEEKAIEAARPGDMVEIYKDDGTTETIVPIPAPPPAPKSSGSGIKVEYEGGNSFSTSKSAVPTGVEIDGVPVSFTGNGSSFTVNSIPAGAKWVTVRWNSTSVTTNFTPDGGAYFAEVEIPKTGDMPLWAAVAELLGF